MAGSKARKRALKSRGWGRGSKVLRSVVWAEEEAGPPSSRLTAGF